MPDKVYFIKSKNHLVTVYSEAVKRRICDLSQGSFIGEINVVSNCPNSWTYIPIEDSKMLTLDATVLQEVMDEYPDFARFIRHRTFRRISFWKCLEIGIKRFLDNEAS